MKSRFFLPTNYYGQYVVSVSLLVYARAIEQETEYRECRWTPNKYQSYAHKYSLYSLRYSWDGDQTTVMVP